MAILVVGASGATGRLLVARLLNRGKKVKVIVRSTDRLPKDLLQNDKLLVIEASVLSLSGPDMARYAQGCEAVVSCLGHNLSFKGVFGSPRKLVTDTVRRLCSAIKENKPGTPVKFVLMNSSGVRNGDLSEKISFAQKCVVLLLRLLLPPHADNENAAEYFRTEVGQCDTKIEWVVVRPDALINEAEVTEYELHPSPIRSAIFNAGKVSRMNVGSFIAELVIDNGLWSNWKGKMPVIYSSNA